MAFARLLQIVQLRAQFPNYVIKIIHLGNAGESISQTFSDYCMLVGITIEHQNSLAKSFIKRLQLIARPLVIEKNLSFLFGYMLFYIQQHLDTLG